MLKVDVEFLDRIKLGSDFDAAACINCGSCVALCPLETNLLPRRLFRYVLMGAKDKVLENSSLIYSCLLCKMCEDNCPAGVHIAENMRSLRTYLNKDPRLVIASPITSRSNLKSPPAQQM
jgi:heterodisulfide reductase subunit C